MAENPLLLRGFETGWIQKFFNEPFDPLCVMLAMRTKLLLDVIDEMGHSYNLLRMIGYGWIDFGDIPGEEPGDPGSYYPPVIDDPIIITPPIVPPGPGEPGYVPPTPGPGEPGYVPPGPGEPGYVPPGPGEPGYVPPMPGEPGYVPPTPGPGEPGYVPPTPGPGEPGYVPPGPGEPGYVPIGGPGGLGGPGGSLAPPLGSGGVGDIFGPAGRSSTSPSALNCCLDKDDIYSYVHIGYATLEMDCGDIQGLTVEGYNEACEAAIYTWAYLPAQGTLIDNEDYTATYTAPEGGPDCETPVTIYMYCNEMLVDQIEIVINPCPFTAEISYTSQQMQINEQQTLLAITSAPGCGIPVYDWAITSGGGSLSLAQGASTVYTAPATNPECALNPTISLSCGGGILDTLQLAINAASGEAYHTNFHDFTSSETDCGAPCNCGCWSLSYDGYHCDGTFHQAYSFSDPYYCGCFGVCHPTQGWCWEGAACPGVCIDPFDLRSPALKAAGCCPVALI